MTKHKGTTAVIYSRCLSFAVKKIKDINNKRQQKRKTTKERNITTDKGQRIKSEREQHKENKTKSDILPFCPYLKKPLQLLYNRSTKPKINKLP